MAKSLCSMSGTEFPVYYGWSNATLVNLSKRPDTPLWSPAQSILTRHLLHDPLQCMFPPKPIFRSVLERINDNVNIEAYWQEFGARRKKKLSPRRLVLLMGLSLSAEHRLMRGTEPSPTVARLLQHITRLMDELGEEQGFARFVSLAREEAAARGMALSQVFESNSWGVKEEIEAQTGQGE